MTGPGPRPPRRRRPAPIRVLALEEHARRGDAARIELADQPDLEFVGRARGLTAALRRAAEADIVLVPATLGDDGAHRAIRAIAAHPSEVRVVVTDVPPSPAVALDYLEAGARGLVYLGAPVAALAEQVRAVAAGRSLVDPVVAGGLVARVERLARLCADHEIDVARLSALTDREMEVLRLIERGASNAEIARRLAIGVGTVKNHVHRVLAKLDVATREEAGLYLRLFDRNEAEQR